MIKRDNKRKSINKLKIAKKDNKKSPINMMDFIDNMLCDTSQKLSSKNTPKNTPKVIIEKNEFERNKSQDNDKREIIIIDNDDYKVVKESAKENSMKKIKYIQ